MDDIEVKINNKGIEQELALMKQFSNASVKVGVQSDAGVHSESGENLVDIAIWNEFGTEKIPSRPFIRQCFADHQGFAEQRLQGIVLNVVRGSDLRLELARLGQQYEDKQKYTLQNPPWEPNAKATIKRKKSSKPLIDTAQLVNSIRYQVEA